MAPVGISERAARVVISKPYTVAVNLQYRVEKAIEMLNIGRFFVFSRPIFPTSRSDSIDINGMQPGVSFFMNSNINYGLADRTRS